MILVGQSAVCVCVGKSYIDEPLVGTVILPQIGELPVHLSTVALPDSLFQ